MEKLFEGTIPAELDDAIAIIVPLTFLPDDSAKDLVKEILRIEIMYN